MNFSTKLIVLILALFFALLAYTVWLLRSEKLTTHIAVRWIMAEILAIFTLALWKYLPFIKYTEKLNDRQLLILVCVAAFVFFVFFLLYSFTHISSHTRQMRTLTQEFALLRQKMAENGIDDGSATPTKLDAPNSKSFEYKNIIPQLLIFIWGSACIWATFAENALPPSIKALLTTAHYME